MESFDHHLTWMESTTGPEFASAIEPGGVLREWIVQHLADEMGEDPETAEGAVDAWLDRRHGEAVASGADEVLRLDDRIEMLLERRRDLDDTEDEVEIAYLDAEIGAAMADAGRPIDALSRFMAARDAFTGLGIDLQVGVCGMEIAMVARNLGWHEASRRLYERARPVIARNGTVGDFARLLLNQANLEKATGETDEAFELQQRARWLAYEAQQIETYAVATHNLGNSASAQDEFEAAIELFLEARSIYVELDDLVSAADCDKNAGAAMIDNGHYSDGLELARAALEVYLDRGQPVEIAHALRTIAHALDHLGDRETAVIELERARATFDEMGRLPDVAACDIDLSYTLRSVGRFDDAAAAVVRAQDAYREMRLNADDPWFADTLAAIERGEVDRHEHPSGGDREESPT